MIGTPSISTSSFQGLIYSVFQQPVVSDHLGGFVVALVAAHGGAGTTLVSSLLAESLERDGKKSVGVFDCRELAGETAGDGESSATALEQRHRVAPLGLGSWRGDREYRAKYLSLLRERFDYVLIDCQSLKDSTDVLGLAPLVDGVLLITEANKTTKSQIALLEHSIESAEGRVLGHVLTKRTYPIPEWLHGRMQKWGL